MNVNFNPSAFVTYFNEQSYDRGKSDKGELIRLQCLTVTFDGKITDCQKFQQVEVKYTQQVQ